MPLKIRKLNICTIDKSENDKSDNSVGERESWCFEENKGGFDGCECGRCFINKNRGGLSSRYNNSCLQSISNSDENEQNIKSTNKKQLNSAELFDQITSYNISDYEISEEMLTEFFFREIPAYKTLMTNVNIVKNKKESLCSKIAGLFKRPPPPPNSIDASSSQLFPPPSKAKETHLNSLDFELEFLYNHKVFYFAKIRRFFPFLKVKFFTSGDARENLDGFKEAKREKFSGKDVKNAVERISFSAVGKMESNCLRNKFLCFEGENGRYRARYLIVYDINPFGLFGIRNLKVYKLHPNTKAKKIDFYSENNYDLLFENKPPIWDGSLKTYKLNFNHRVKQKSKKNFILKNVNNKEEENVLQCGKINDDCFCLDFICNCSPFLAFCVGVSSILNKILSE